MSGIKYYSTNLKSEKVSFQHALLKGLAPDGGLYMPDAIPKISKDELISLKNKEYHEIAFFVLEKFLSGSVPSEELAKMASRAYNYSVPLENVCHQKYIMRLDQGPTASFKDFAARMMGQLIQFYLQQDHRKMLILTATSGDTGSAMANAFYGLENINIAVLFPKAEVTERQRKQMTTLHDNVEVIALDGKFDDCQALVKKAFNDRELDYLNLTSANSINIGRLIPQAVYYIYAYTKLCNAAQSEEIVFSVPSGNFGNLMGGLLALKMGLPVKKFVVATNANDEVPVYFASGNYKTIVPSRNCISSAMNVGHPSNIARIVALYGGIMNENGDIIKRPDLEGMKKDMYTVSIDDMATRRALKSVHKQYNVILEPHGAVAWEGLSQFMALNHLAENSNQVFVSLETAHPAKFPEEINGLLGFSPELPASLLSLENKEEKLQDLPYNYNVFKEYLKQKYE